MPLNNVIIMAVMTTFVLLMLIMFSPALILQIFLKVAEESGVDAETSGNCLEGEWHT